MTPTADKPLVSPLVDDDAPAPTVRGRLRTVLLDQKNSTVPLVWAHTQEDDRFFKSERRTLLKLDKQFTPALYRYSATGALEEYVSWEAPEPFRRQDNDQTAGGPSAILNWFARRPPQGWTQTSSADQPIIGEGEESNTFAAPGSILFLFDIGADLQHHGGSNHSSPSLTRLLKDHYEVLIGQGKMVVLASHTLDVPQELEHDVVMVEHPLPDETDITLLVQESCKQLFTRTEERELPGGKRETRTVQAPLQLTVGGRRELIDQLKGLTAREIDTALSRAATANRLKIHHDPAHPRGFDLPVIRSERVKAIRKNPALSVIESQGGLELVGGMEELKGWLADNEMFFGNKYVSEGATSPKGILIFGPGGTGKTHCVSCLGTYLRRTVLRLDVGALKGGIVGQTEANTRRAFRDIRAQAPCVVLVDEAGKMFPNARGGVGATLDGGTSSSMYAAFLVEMQENQGDVFYVLCCNEDIQNFPAPALRSGRIDRVFFTDLPKKEERAEVARIHLRKRGWGAPEFLALVDHPKFDQKTENYTPSEIEQVVNSAIKLKIRQVGPKPSALTLDHLLNGVDAITPMYRTHRSEVENIRRFAAENGYVAKSNANAGSNAAAAPAGRAVRSTLSVADLELDDNEDEGAEPKAA